MSREGTGYVDTERLKGGGDPTTDPWVDDRDPRGLADLILDQGPLPLEVGESTIDPDRSCRIE